MRSLVNTSTHSVSNLGMRYHLSFICPVPRSLQGVLLVTKWTKWTDLFVNNNSNKILLGPDVTPVHPVPWSLSSPQLRRVFVDNLPGPTISICCPVQFSRYVFHVTCFTLAALCFTCFVLRLGDYSGPVPWSSELPSILDPGPHTMAVDYLPGPTITERLLLLARLLKFDRQSDPVCHLQRWIPTGVLVYPRLQSRHRRHLVSPTTFLPPRRVLKRKLLYFDLS